MRSVLALIALPALAGAMELTIADVGLAVGAGPADFGFVIDNGTTSVSGEDTAESSLCLRLSVRKGFPARARSWGPVVGLDLIGHELDLGGGTVRGGGAAAFAGLGWAPFDRVALLIGPIVGIGLERMELEPGAAHGGLSASGTGYGYGARATVLANLTRRWLVALDAGWEASRLRLDGDGTEVELTPRGFTAGIGLVWRFDPMPVRLE